MDTANAGRSRRRFFDRLISRFRLSRSSANEAKVSTGKSGRTELSARGDDFISTSVSRAKHSSDIGDCESVASSVIIMSSSVKSKPRVGGASFSTGSSTSGNTNANAGKDKEKVHGVASRTQSKGYAKSDAVSGKSKINLQKRKRNFGSKFSVNSMLISSLQSHNEVQSSDKKKSQSASDLQRPSSQLSECSYDSNSESDIAAMASGKKASHSVRSGKSLELECPLCFAKLPSYQFPRLTNCNHRSCISCLMQYLQLEILESRVIICCPECPEALHPSDIYNILATAPRLIVKWEEFSVRRVLMNDPDSRWCPAPDCNYVVIASGCAGCPVLRCERPGCGTYFCYHCKQEWHADQTCDEARAQRGSFTTSPIRLDSTIKPSDVKACPRCHTFIVKMQDGSCNHMVCALCGAEFCWLCLKEISDLHYLSPSGCTFWGKKPWSRKKKLLWQLGTLIGAPVGIALIASLAVPAIIFGVPVWIGRKIHQRLRRSTRSRHHFAIIGGVLASIILSPVLAGLAVGVGVPIMLAYVYGVVPFSLCRNGTCGMTASVSGVRLVNVDDDILAMTGLLDKDGAEKSPFLTGDGHDGSSTVAGLSMQSGSTHNRLQVQAEVFPYRRRPSMESGVTILGDRMNYEEASLRALAGSTYCDDKSVHTIGSANEAVSYYADDASLVGLAGSVCGARSAVGVPAISEHKSIVSAVINRSIDTSATASPTAGDLAALLRPLSAASTVVPSTQGATSATATQQQHQIPSVVQPGSSSHTANVRRLSKVSNISTRSGTGSSNFEPAFSGTAQHLHHHVHTSVGPLPKAVRESAEDVCSLESVGSTSVHHHQAAGHVRAEFAGAAADTGLGSDSERNMDDASTKSLAGSLLAYDQKSVRSHDVFNPADVSIMPDPMSGCAVSESQASRKLSPNTFVVCAECHKRASLDNCSLVFMDKELASSSGKSKDTEASLSNTITTSSTTSQQPSTTTTTAILHGLKHVPPAHSALKKPSTAGVGGTAQYLHPRHAGKHPIFKTDDNEAEPFSIYSFEGGFAAVEPHSSASEKGGQHHCSILLHRQEASTPYKRARLPSGGSCSYTAATTTMRNVSMPSRFHVTRHAADHHHDADPTGAEAALAKSPSLSFVWDTLAAIQEVRRMKRNRALSQRRLRATSLGSLTASGVTHRQTSESAAVATARNPTKFASNRCAVSHNLYEEEDCNSLEAADVTATLLQSEQRLPELVDDDDAATVGKAASKEASAKHSRRRFADFFTSPLRRNAETSRLHQPRASEGAISVPSASVDSPVLAPAGAKPRKMLSTGPAATPDSKKPSTVATNYTSLQEDAVDFADDEKSMNFNNDSC